MTQPVCLNCQRHGLTIYARGLCRSCYLTHQTAGTLHRFPKQIGRAGRNPCQKCTHPTQHRSMICHDCRSDPPEDDNSIGSGAWQRNDRGVLEFVPDTPDIRQAGWRITTTKTLSHQPATRRLVAATP